MILICTNISIIFHNSNLIGYQLKFNLYFQTKAAYVLFYQRRDLSNMSKMPIANDSRLCNGQTNSKNYNSMNGTLATEQSAEEDMEIDQNGK